MIVAEMVQAMLQCRKYDGLININRSCACFGSEFQHCPAFDPTCIGATVFYDDDNKMYLTGDSEQYRVRISNKTCQFPDIYPKHIADINDQDLLEKIVHGHTWQQVQAAAIERLYDQERLARIVLNLDLPRTICRKALLKLKRKDELILVALNHCDEFCKIAVGRLDDQVILIYLLHSKPNLEITSSLLSRITDERVLQFLGICNRGFGIGAIEFMFDRVLLEQLVSISVFNQAAALVAKKRLAFLHGSDPDKVTLDDINTYDPEFGEACGHRSDLTLDKIRALMSDNALVRVAMFAEDSDKQLVAVKQVRNPALLTLMAAQSPSRHARVAAIERIDDPVILASIIYSVSCPNTQLAAIKRLTDQRFLQLAAYHARKWAPCAAAVKRITEPELLEQLLKWRTDEQFFVIVSKRLHELGAVV